MAARAPQRHCYALARTRCYAASRENSCICRTGRRSVVSIPIATSQREELAMLERRTVRLIFFAFVIALQASSARAGLDRPPEILQSWEVADSNSNLLSIRLLWAPGGKS